MLKTTSKTGNFFKITGFTLFILDELVALVLINYNMIEKWDFLINRVSDASLLCLFIGLVLTIISNLERTHPYSKKIKVLIFVSASFAYLTIILLDIITNGLVSNSFTVILKVMILMQFIGSIYIIHLLLKQQKETSPPSAPDKRSLK